MKRKRNTRDAAHRGCGIGWLDFSRGRRSPLPPSACVWRNARLSGTLSFRLGSLALRPASVWRNLITVFSTVNTPTPHVHGTKPKRATQNAFDSLHIRSRFRANAFNAIATREKKALFLSAFRRIDAERLRSRTCNGMRTPIAPTRAGRCVQAVRKQSAHRPDLAAHKLDCAEIARTRKASGDVIVAFGACFDRSPGATRAFRHASMETAHAGPNAIDGRHPRLPEPAEAANANAGGSAGILPWAVPPRRRPDYSSSSEA